MLAHAWWVEAVNLQLRLVALQRLWAQAVGQPSAPSPAPRAPALPPPAVEPADWLRAYA